MDPHKLEIRIPHKRNPGDAQADFNVTSFVAFGVLGTHLKGNPADISKITAQLKPKDGGDSIPGTRIGDGMTDSLTLKGLWAFTFSVPKSNADYQLVIIVPALGGARSYTKSLDVNYTYKPPPLPNVTIDYPGPNDSPVCTDLLAWGTNVQGFSPTADNTMMTLMPDSLVFHGSSVGGWGSGTSWMFSFSLDATSGGQSYTLNVGDASQRSLAAVDCGGTGKH
jgi:hypothetical protein